MHCFQWLSHIELLQACFYLYRTRIQLTNGTNYTYQEWSLSIKVQQCSISTMTWQNSYPIRPWMNKWLSPQSLTPLQPSYLAVINESNQLQPNGIPHYQEHWIMTLQPKCPTFLTLFYLTQIYYSNFITLSRKEEAFIQDGWHDFTEEQRDPFQGTHQSRVGILRLTILLLILFKQGFSRSMTFVYRKPCSECELHLNAPSR
jgi:hypothetical protein